MEQEIREALKRATAGPWSMNDMDSAYSNEVFVNPTGHQYIEIAGGLTIENAHLIANTPTYLEWCLSQISDQQALKEKAEKTVEGLRRLVQLVNEERDEYKTAYESSYERNMQANVAIGNVARERDDLQTENSRLKEDNAALQDQVTALQEERDHLLAANDEYQEKLRFEGEEER